VTVQFLSGRTWVFASVAGALRECTFWPTPYGSNAVLKSIRDCTMLGLSMRRVGLIDITVGNATRLGASQRSATRRSASHHIATQRLSRWGSPAARARLARTVPLKHLWLRDGHVKRNTCERMNSPLRDVPCSNADIDLRPERDQAGRHHRIPINQSADFSDGHFAPGSVRLSQKSHKVAVLLGIILLSALSLPDRREGGSGGSRCRRAVRALLGWFKGP
jgi:hypothetical protein